MAKERFEVSRGSRWGGPKVHRAPWSKENRIRYRACSAPSGFNAIYSDLLDEIPEGVDRCKRCFPGWEAPKGREVPKRVASLPNLPRRSES